MNGWIDWVLQRVWERVSLKVVVCHTTLIQKCVTPLIQVALFKNLRKFLMRCLYCALPLQAHLEGKATHAETSANAQILPSTKRRMNLLHPLPQEVAALLHRRSCAGVCAFVEVGVTCPKQLSWEPVHVHICTLHKKMGGERKNEWRLLLLLLVKK